VTVKLLDAELAAAAAAAAISHHTLLSLL